MTFFFFQKIKDKTSTIRKNKTRHNKTVFLSNDKTTAQNVIKYKLAIVITKLVEFSYVDRSSQCKTLYAKTLCTFVKRYRRTDPFCGLVLSFDVSISLIVVVLMTSSVALNLFNDFDVHVLEEKNKKEVFKVACI